VWLYNLYYGGYKFGHKMDRWEGRQIGLVKMQRDRYVSRDAGPDGGTLITRRAVLAGHTMTVNANVRGELRVALLDAEGHPIPGFSTEDCHPICGDNLSHAVLWQGGLANLRNKAVRIAFHLRDAELYGFDLTPHEPKGL
jgi:hypothetical protein